MKPTNNSSYFKLALATELQDYETPCERIGLQEIRLLHAILGLVTEYLELEKALQDKDPINIVEELGDLYWYIAIAKDLYDFNSGKLLDLSFRDTIEQLADTYKRHIFYGRFDKDKLLKLLSACEYYIDLECNKLNLLPSTVQEKNLLKLKIRYPNAFTTRSALNRDLDSEKTVLENL